jgi:competence protein ComEC
MYIPCTRLAAAAASTIIISPRCGWIYLLTALRSRPFIALAAALAAGVLLGRSIPAPVPAAAVAAAVPAALGLFILLRRNRLWLRFLAPILALLSVAALGFLRVQCGRDSPDRAALRRAVAPAGPENGALLRVEGVVTELERIRPGRDRAVLEIDAERLETETPGRAPAAPDWQPVAGVLRVYLRQDPVLRPGDRVRLLAWWTAPRSEDVPGGFDAAEHASRTGLVASCSLAVPSDIALLQRRSPAAALWSARDRVEGFLYQHLPPASAAITAALVTGEQGYISPSVWLDFQQTGTVHVLVVAGLHLGLITGILWFMFKAACVPLRWRIAPAAVFLLAYAVFTGGRIPVLRSCVMVEAWLIGMWLLRPRDSLNVFAAAAVIALLGWPEEIASPGAQLSFAAVAFIICWSREFSAAGARLAELRRGRNMAPLHADRKPGWTAKALRYILGSLLVSAAAWLGTEPLVARHFGFANLHAVLANLFVVAWAGVMLATIMVGLPVAALLPPACGLACGLLDLELDVLQRIVAAFARLPGAGLPSGEVHPAWLAAWYAAFAIFFMRRSLRLSIVKSLIPIAAVVIAFAAVRLSAPPPPDAEIVVFPGDGSACLIRGNGRTVLVGVGRARRDMLNFLRREGIRDIDLLVIPRDAPQFVADADRLLERVRVRRILLPEHAPSQAVFLLKKDALLAGAEIDAIAPGVLYDSGCVRLSAPGSDKLPFLNAEIGGLSISFMDPTSADRVRAWTALGPAIRADALILPAMPLTSGADRVLRLADPRDIISPQTAFTWRGVDGKTLRSALARAGQTDRLIAAPEPASVVYRFADGKWTRRCFKAGEWSEAVEFIPRSTEP